MSLQLHNSPVVCARELFKPSVSLQVCNEKMIFGFGFFGSDILSGVGFGPFWLRSPGPVPNH